MSNRKEVVRRKAAELWAECVGLDARKIALATLAGGLSYGILRCLLVGDSIAHGVGVGIGTAIGAVMGAFVVAPLVALVGWLTRGSFNMRPLFLACLAQFWLLMIASEIFLPMAFQPTLGVPFYILLPVMMGVGTTLMAFAALMTLVSHRFSYGMFCGSLAMGLFSTYGAYSKYLEPGREAFMASVFNERDAGLARAMDSKRYPSSVIESDFKSMARAFREKR